MKILSLAVATLLIANTQSHAAGLKFEKPQMEQYSDHFDSKIGWITTDNTNQIQITKCFVGEDSKEDWPSCNGSPQALEWEEAMSIARSLGGGWRLPTGAEMVYFYTTNVGFQNRIKAARLKMNDASGNILWSFQKASDGPSDARITFNISDGPSMGWSNIRQKRFVILVRPVQGSGSPKAKMTK